MNEPAAFRFADLSIGQSAEFEVLLSTDLIDRFSRLSGDASPLHMDETFAKTTPFGGRVAHGMLGASFFSRLVGMLLPGKNALYLSQQILFRAPIHPDTLLTVSGIITQKADAARTIRIATHVTDRSTGAHLIDGEALVKLLS